MKPLSSALLFPETVPAVDLTAKLLLFFNSISYYLPTEYNESNSREQNFFTDLCTGYTPVPLNEDLERFKRLLREMENCRSDDLARLFSSARSPIATGQIRDQDESSSGSVLTSLHKDTGNKSRVQHKERLWQARLILKLAEMLDRRENEIRQGLDRISSAEQKVFASLEGMDKTGQDDLEEYPDLAQLTKNHKKADYPGNYSAGGSAPLISIRLKAWAELFLADSSMDRPAILVTGNSNSGSTMLDSYENIFRRAPHKLFSLTIPGLVGVAAGKSAHELYISGRNKLRLAGGELLQYFENFLGETAVLQGLPAGKETVSMIEPGPVADWDRIIKIEFADHEAGLQKLDFYCFPGIAPASLLQKLFHLEPTVTGSEHPQTTSILAILNS